jgi:hypothetical protein
MAISWFNGASLSGTVEKISRIQSMGSKSISMRPFSISINISQVVIGDSQR